MYPLHHTPETRRPTERTLALRGFLATVLLAVAVPLTVFAVTNPAAGAVVVGVAGTAYYVRRATRPFRRAADADADGPVPISTDPVARR